MIIRGIKQTLQGVYEITPLAGSAFFLRTDYLKHLTEEKLLEVAEEGQKDFFLQEALKGTAFENQEEEDVSKRPGFIDEEDEEDLLSSSLIFAAERAAMSYLGRAEQYRSGLVRKLSQKGIDKKYFVPALDFLEEKGILDDFRFASSWLRSRSIDHAEGRSKLASELLNRGVEKNAVKKALDLYFENTDTFALCVKAYRKCLRRKKDEEKIFPFLLKEGFSVSEIKYAISFIADEKSE